ncbi:hypothetical protein [Hyunsoonleella pacifica]|uniref:Uncharacterized protein n=1 Tax=Hyunsoonleella pacifica TaxID=1080224 RepID=A0A4Q9FSB3_9FLAO|nr:hypothetical protein [Hyunsoonleella pacifica]TBN18837.1 hypothetical protein EYD46_01875 [Hyunsoonleella pacifica]GGD05212.1 hypothetical protein GCM10011368_03750 [Hyunsoonleella pacifica]
MRRIIRKSDLADYEFKSLDSKNLRVNPDNHLDKVAKLVPAEIVGAFLAVDNLILSQLSNGTDTLHKSEITYWVVFFILLVATPFYVKRAISSEFKLLKSQIFVSTLAFVFWVYAIGGPFKLTDIHDYLFAGLGLILFSVISPLLIPKK